MQNVEVPGYGQAWQILHSTALLHPSEASRSAPPDVLHKDLMPFPIISVINTHARSLLAKNTCKISECPRVQQQAEKHKIKHDGALSLPPHFSYHFGTCQNITRGKTSPGNEQGFACNSSSGHDCRHCSGQVFPSQGLHKTHLCTPVSQ